MRCSPRHINRRIGYIENDLRDKAHHAPADIVWLVCQFRELEKENAQFKLRIKELENPNG